MRNWSIFYATALSMALLVSGCSTAPLEDESSPLLYQDSIVAEKYSSGSLFSRTNDGNWLKSRKAKRVGDIVIIHLNESVNSRKLATSGYSKGQEVGVADMRVGSKSIEGLELSSDYDFSGRGTNTLTNSLKGTISVQITEVIDYDTFRIYGERDIDTNGEQEKIILTGLIRSQDIRFDNSLQSSQVAKARITYETEGFGRDSSQPGWLMGWVYKYFPF